MEKCFATIVAFSLVFHSWCQAPFQNYMRVMQETPISRVVTSATADGGLLMATLQAGKCGVTKLDENGSVIWSKLVEPGPTQGFFSIHTIEEIDGGPAFYLLAIINGLPELSSTPGFVLVEVNDMHQVVFSNYYGHWFGICGHSLLTDFGAAKAYRSDNGGYLLAMPENPNHTCVFGVAFGGDTLYSRIYSDYPGGGAFFAGATSIVLNDGSILLLNRADDGFNLMRVAQNGDIMWSKTYQTGTYSIPTAAVQLSNDSLRIAGIHGVSNFEYWGFSIQMDVLGNVAWHRRFDLFGQDQVIAGHPLSLTRTATDECIMHLGQYSMSYLARTNQAGNIVSVDRLQDQQIMFSEYSTYPSFVPTFSVDDRLYITTAVEYPGEPWWNDSIMVAGVSEVADLACGLTPATWFEEPWPGTMPVIDNGSFAGSVWFRTGEIDIQITEQDWIVEPFCLSTSISDLEAQPIFRLQPSIVQRGQGIYLRSTAPLRGEVQILDMHGRSVWLPRSMNGQELEIGTEALAAGIYHLRISTAQLGDHILRFAVVNE